MRPYILLESNWKDLKDATIDVAILPWGATEAHNYHLPYGTDVIEAEQIAAESARKAYEQGSKVMVLPTIPYGVNTGQTDIFLDMNLNPSTQFAIIKDLVTVLDRQGVHKLLIFNSHGGNNFKPLLREIGLEFPNMFVSFCNWFQALDKSEYLDYPNGDHADELETSMILHLTPHLVRPLEEAGEGPSKKWKINALNESWAWSERQWSKVTEDTGIGNPKKSTAEKGKRFFDDVSDKIAVFIQELAAADLNDMYE